MLELIDLKAILIIAMIFIPLERLLPLYADQKMLRKHWLNDVIYLFFNGILIKLGFVALVGAMMFAIRLVIPEGMFAVVQAQPIWLQAIEVTLVADIGFYLAHRAFHSVPFLWKFHSVHHSIEEMDWLAAHRVHPVDQIATMTASMLPVYALGFSGSAIAIYAFMYQAQSLLIHSNTRIRFGPLKWVLASPQFHHWHHANERQAYDKNFAGQLPFIDALAGTLYMPERMPRVYGTDDPVPPLYHQQLAYPLKQIAGRVPAAEVSAQTGDSRP
ncbi:sterol desaturase family protein [Rhizobium sullae]|uniref:sterol desaturase family protein n=1 Tax=Rhizobium sullae TaxID=50338 RepID=UPI000B35D1F2|nr:sterol desaturase family protein [Rhizobium sullae]